MIKNELCVFYSFRFICSMMVLLYHAGVMENGSYFVTFFILLSGFFSVYTYKEKDLGVSIKYMLCRMKKFFPIHILAFICSIPLFVDTLCCYAVEKRILVTLCYNTFLQALVPQADFYFAYNGVEWTMSVLCWCYLVTPLTINILKKIKIDSWKKFLVIVSVVYVFEVVYICIFKNYENYVWICGVNPLFRFWDYFIGCCLGCLYINLGEQDKNKSSFTQVLVLILVFIIYVNVIPKLNPAYCWSLVMTPVSVLIIIVFAMMESQKGFLCNLLANKYFVSLGKRSFEIYMLHLIVLRYIQMFGNCNIYVNALLVVSVTLVLSYICHYFLGRKNKQSNQLSK